MISRADRAGDRGRPGSPYEGPYGDYVNLDLTHLGEGEDQKRLPLVRELARIYVGVDPLHEPIPIRPVVHYMMGGVDTDIDGATDLAGALRRGRVRACVSLNGANRLGSNSLTECLVFGARAAASTPCTSRGQRARATSRRCARQAEAGGGDASRRCGAIRQGSGEKIAQVRDARCTSSPWRTGCGVYREQGPMDADGAGDHRRAAGPLRGTSRSTTRARCSTPSSSPPSSWSTCSTCAESVANSAAHQRKRVPRRPRLQATSSTRDDQNYLHHTLVLLHEAGPAHRQEGRRPWGNWEPEERKY